MLNVERWKNILIAIRTAGEFFAVRKGVPCECSSTECKDCDFSEETCEAETIRWLCEEYKGSEINWDKDIDWGRVPAGTPVMVSDVQECVYIKCSFAVYVPKAKRKYMTLIQRGEHGDAEGVESWNYCRLANPEDIEKYRRK